MHEFKTVSDLHDLMIKSISKIYFTFVANYIENLNMISEDIEVNEYSTVNAIERLFKLKLSYMNQYSKMNYNDYDDDYDDIAQSFNFKEYYNFGRILLDYIVDFLDVNISLDIEGEENLRNEMCFYFAKTKYLRVSPFKKNHYSSYFWVKKVDLFIKNHLNWKLHHWKSILYSSSYVKKCICRICDEQFILNEFVLHLCCCKNQNSHSNKLKEIKVTLTNMTNKMLDDFPDHEEKEKNLFTAKSKFLENFTKQVKRSLPDIVSAVYLKYLN